MTDLRARFEARGQGHVFAHHDRLDASGRDRLAAEAASLDLDELDSLFESLVRRPGPGGGGNDDAGLEPARYIPLPDSPGGDPAVWRKAFEKGEAALRAGRVAAFTVAGGQGTRLGHDGPKGTFPVTPVLGKPLFQVFAEKILAAHRIYGKPVPWYLMTSEANHEETVAFFRSHDFFGLPAERVRFFSQGHMPAVDAEGRILLAAPDRIALSPDGHGGALRALVRSGSIRQMEADGIDTISYFQVDNPLVRCLDPAFIGFHLLKGSEMSSKMVPKAYAEEKVGVFCERGGRALVVEYSDLPERLASETDAQGGLRFRAGSIAIHLFSRTFVETLGSASGNDDGAGFRLPFHLARKKVPFCDAEGRLVEPEEPNACKFEMFVFDALPFAKNPVIVETDRAEDFSPVKNAEGLDSPATCRADQLRQSARWLRQAGVDLELDADGVPTLAVEVSPLFADTPERFAAAWARLESPPRPVDGLVIS